MMTSRAETPFPISDMTALPTIHLNGTGADSLQREYRAVRKAIAAAAAALAAATCNRRDFYPQDPSAWHTAQAERAEAFRLLRLASDYAEAWELHALDARREQGRP